METGKIQIALKSHFQNGDYAVDRFCQLVEITDFRIFKRQGDDGETKEGMLVKGIRPASRSERIMKPEDLRRLVLVQTVTDMMSVTTEETEEEPSVTNSIPIEREVTTELGKEYWQYAIDYALNSEVNCTIENELAKIGQEKENYKDALRILNSLDDAGILYFIAMNKGTLAKEVLPSDI